MKLYIEEEFWTDLYERLDSCQEEIYIQFMTFEGDKTGLELSAKLIELAAKGIKIKVLIDVFTDFYVSDKAIANPTVYKEVFDTQKMMIDMRKAGIQLKRTRPYGLFGKNFLARNHKKIVIIDDYVYLGGMNVSDHNRSWFDFMVGIEDKEVIRVIKRDFSFTFSGREINWGENNVFTTKELEKKYLKLVTNAENEIILSSPYILDLSLLNLLRHKREIKKMILTVRQNNFDIIDKLNPYLLHNIQKINTDIFFYKKFSHAKFLLVDRKYLLIGSSNFGKDSFLTMQEIGIVIEDKKFIDQFYKRVIEGSEFKKCETVPNKFISRIINYIAYFVLFYYAKFIAREIPVLKKEKLNY